MVNGPDDADELCRPTPPEALRNSLEPEFSLVPLPADQQGQSPVFDNKPMNSKLRSSAEFPPEAEEEHLGWADHEQHVSIIMA